MIQRNLARARFLAVSAASLAFFAGITKARTDSQPLERGGTAPTQPATTEFDDTNELIGSLFRVQFDHHLDEKLFLDHDPSAKLTTQRCEEALRRLRPASVTVCSLGHEGWARVSGAVLAPHPALSKDSLAIWREACDRTQTPLFIYVSSLINYKANHEHPEYARLFSNGNPADQRIDHNSAFVDEKLIPFCRELVSRYRPDGLWFDGDYWSVFPSWNPASISAFERQAGRKAPVDFADPAFPAFWEFTTRSHAQYVEKVAAAVRAVNPSCGLVINSAYTLRQPEPLPAYVARVNLDVPTYFGLEAASLEAHFQGARDNRPFDIVISGHCAPEGAPYAYTKPRMQLLQEMAAILSHGGGVSVYVGLDVDGGFSVDEVADVREVLEQFARPRAAALLPSVSAADVALLHSAADFRHTHRLERLRGAALALLRSNIAFDIVDDSLFMANPRRYRSIVLPLTAFTSNSLIESAEKFVADGGHAVITLAATADTAERLKQNRKLFPVTTAEFRALQLSVVGAEDGAIASGYIALQCSPGAVALREIAGSGTALINRYAVGRGRVSLISADLPAEFDRAANPRVRQLLADELRWSDGADPSLVVAAPPWIETVSRRAGDHRIIHLVNHARGREGRSRAPAVESIPSAAEVSLTLRCDKQPASVRCVPDETGLEYSWSAGRLSARLTNIGVHCALLIDAP
ncbi:MAG: alpha-L-fucosidase [Phycisphaerales bacterium]|nr:alpha-L-fucosidase [Phycisphaerales bacterium]